MPTTIVRGFSFQINDIVDADDLNDLVRRATISGFSAGDISGGALGISIFSAASGASIGTVSYEYEDGDVITGGPYAEVKYLIHQVRGGQVSLFTPGGLETRRFVNRDQAPILRGSAWVADDVGGGAGVTLLCTIGYTTGTSRHDSLGSSRGTANTSPTDPRGIVRHVLHGIAPARVVDAGDTIRKYYFQINAATGQHQHSPGATSTDKVYALAMRPADSGDTTLPAYFFGAPIWRQ